MISIRACSPSDIPELARMNRMLIEDEQADNAMTVPQLELRMAEFLGGAYRAYFFDADGSRVGYALVDTGKTPPYLRHFFICRESRRMGYGKDAFSALLRLLQANEIDLDVYVWNRRGLSFWKSLGFQERCLGMRLKR